MGAVIPPHQSYQARAPIHPKRPYGLTRPVVPPDGSFLFSAYLSEVDAGSREDNASKQESRSFGSDSIGTEALGIRSFEASHSFSLRLRIAAAVRCRRSRNEPQLRYACAKLDSKTQQISGGLRYLMTNAVSLLDKSNLFHKIFMSRLN